MNFDWYGASADHTTDEVLGEAAGAFPGTKMVDARPFFGYERAVAFTAEGSQVCRVMWSASGRNRSGGGSSMQGQETCFIEGTGRNAPRVAEFIREKFPVHRVARVDVAEDYTGDGAWDRLTGVSFEVADLYNVKTEHAGDHHRAIEGRSIYVGGRTSVVRVICYEKGKQLGTDPNHVRVELRVRPGTRTAKYRAARSTPIELYGASRWSRELGERLTNCEIERLKLGTVYRDDDATRARKFMLKQYGHTLMGLQDELGRWTAVGEWIGAQLSADE